MKRSNFQVLCFLMVLAQPMMAFSQTDKGLEKTSIKQSMDTAAEIAPEVNKCIQDLKFSDVSYEDLKKKLTATLNEKNKSLIFLEFRGLQAQVDILVSHLMSEDVYSKEDTAEILTKITAYLDQLESLLAKAKANAKLIKEEHVVPLATLTSLKSESDKCMGIKSQFTVIFKHVSQLNKDLNEILMMSPQRILAQKETVKNLVRKIEDNNIGLTSKNISEPLNFIQNQINTVTHTFEFDTQSLNMAQN